MIKDLVIEREYIVHPSPSRLWCSKYLKDDKVSEGDSTFLKNRLKMILKSGGTAIGSFVWTGCSDIAEIMNEGNFDFLIFDMEHGPIGIEQAQDLVRAVKGSDTTPLIRVAWNDPVLIKQALDIGAYGVVVPGLRSRDDAVRAVKACRYPPKGFRGVGPRRAAGYGLRFREYVTYADNEIVSIMQIETKDALKNIDEIVSVKGVDALLIGPGDLSADLGFLGDIKNPKLLEAYDTILYAAKKVGVAAGIWVGTAEECNLYVSKGYRFLAIGSDTHFLLKGIMETVEKILR